MTLESQRTEDRLGQSLDGGSPPRTVAAALWFPPEGPHRVKGRACQPVHHQQDPPRTTFGRDGGAFPASRIFKAELLANRLKTKPRRP